MNPNTLYRNGGFLDKRIFKSVQNMEAIRNASPDLARELNDKVSDLAKKRMHLLLQKVLGFKRAPPNKTVKIIKDTEPDPFAGYENMKIGESKSYVPLKKAVKGGALAAALASLLGFGAGKLTNSNKKEASMKMDTAQDAFVAGILKFAADNSLSKADTALLLKRAAAVDKMLMGLQGAARSGMASKLMGGGAKATATANKFFGPGVSNGVASGLGLPALRQARNAMPAQQSLMQRLQAFKARKPVPQNIKPEFAAEGAPVATPAIRPAAPMNSSASRAGFAPQTQAAKPAPAFPMLGNAFGRGRVA